jgi:hypothetical protein
MGGPSVLMDLGLRMILAAWCDLSGVPSYRSDAYGVYYLLLLLL